MLQAVTVSVFHNGAPLKIIHGVTIRGVTKPDVKDGEDEIISLQPLPNLPGVVAGIHTTHIVLQQSLSPTKPGVHENYIAI